MKDSTLLSFLALSVAILAGSLLVASGLREVARAIQKIDAKVSITVPTTKTEVRVIREGLPLPIREAGL